jgi:hypothetical protein
MSFEMRMSAQVGASPVMCVSDISAAPERRL